MPRLTFRRRVILGAALAVTTALIAAAGAAYVTVERNLRSDFDVSLVRWTQDKAVADPAAEDLRLVPAPRRTEEPPAPRQTTPRSSRNEGRIDPSDSRNDGVRPPRIVQDERPSRAPGAGQGTGRPGLQPQDGMRPPARDEAGGGPRGDPRPPRPAQGGEGPPPQGGGDPPPGGGGSPPPGGGPPSQGGGGQPYQGAGGQPHQGSGESPRGGVAPGPSGSRPAIAERFINYTVPASASARAVEEERTLRPTFGGPVTYWQLVDRTGKINRPDDQEALPISARDRAVATGADGPYFWEGEVQGVALRGYTTRIAPGIALQVARPTAAVDQTLADLARILVIVTLVGIALGAVLAWLAMRRSLRPVVELTRQTEDVAATGDLARRVDEVGNDELGRLAHTFNDTLERLEQSAQAQQQLVADASHELRTPLASLRANVEILRKYADMDPVEREELLGDVVTQSEELSRLISDIVHAGDRLSADDHAAPVALDGVVRDAVARIERLVPGVVIEAQLEPTTVEGLAERLQRLVGNLLDNAVKYGGGTPVTVVLKDRMLTVRDHGPGFDAEHLDLVFERFWRADTSRALPGSGLGLAIVRGVAQMHGATVSAGNAPGGGALITVCFP